ncbi:MAG: hypothetical protein ACLP4W_30350 [Mycobacterium sp.]|uniref:hypothetical protein n=1 Tax=Mycobacterium sp. TaxID=1785 RepID=UPI003F9AF314
MHAAQPRSLPSVPRAVGIELDEVRCEAEFAQTTEDLDLGSWTIPAGCVAGVTATWQGLLDSRVIIELTVRWRKGTTLQPDWKVKHGYVAEVTGMPSAKLRFDILPPPDFDGKTMDDFMVLGMVATAMPAVQAIPAVCAAKPGIITYLDLPLISAHGYLRS